MGVMKPGYYPNTAFPDMFMIDDYWPDFSSAPLNVFRGTPSVTDLLTANGAVRGYNAVSSVTSRQATPGDSGSTGEITII